MWPPPLLPASLLLLPVLAEPSAEPRLPTYPSQHPSSYQLSPPFNQETSHFQSPSYSPKPAYASSPSHLYPPSPSYHPSPYCANGGACLPPVLCAPSYASLLQQPSSSCLLAPGTPGLCCPPRTPSYSKIGLLEQEPYPANSKSPYDFDLFTLDHAAKVGIFQVDWVTEFEKELSRRSVFVNKGSAGFMHFAFFKSKDEAREASDDVSKSIFGSQDLSHRFSLTPQQAGFGLKAFSTRETILEEFCPAPARCDSSHPYRSFNASCNNLRSPLWATAGSPFQRSLLPSYSDGVWDPKVAKSGRALPSARLISINVIPDVDLPDSLDTHNLMQWGQFVDHDLTHTPLFRLSDTNSSGVKCCTEDGQSPQNRITLHPRCFSIDIPSNDPFYSKHEQRCMNFVRSMPGPGQDCTFGYAEQMNQISHLHDSSQVYGSDEEDAVGLRDLEGGRMKSYKTGGKDLLPQEEGDLEGEECEVENKKPDTKDRKCFKAGDSRSNEHTGLVAFHTVWLREHNRLAAELHYLNPHWEDERLYQEARRILIAEMQHITYNEWLPIVLGPDYMDQLDILPLTHGHSDKYSDKVNPTILNSFATAAFRFGHTLIQGMMDLVKEVSYERETVRMLPLSDQFQNPELIYQPGGLDKFLVGLATQPSQKFDNIISEEVTNHLFQGKDKKFGMDLVALNLQRGRDHGLQGYNAFRQLCGLGRVKTFAGLADLIPVKIVERLKLIYDDVDDVDLFIGGISEAAADGGLLGPTFRCIVGDQFKRLQHGDRFYYENSAAPLPFSPAQLEELRKTSLARLTCDNGDMIHNMQPLAFRTPSPINPLVPCDAITIPIVSLLPWQEGHSQPAPDSAPAPYTQPAPAPAPFSQPAPGPHSHPAPAPLSHGLPSHGGYYKEQEEFRRPRGQKYQPSDFPSSRMKLKAFLHPGVHSPLHRFSLNTNFGR